MSTATMNPSETLSRLSELQQEAAEIQKDYDEKMVNVMSQIAEAASGVSNGHTSPNSPQAARRRQTPAPAARTSPNQPTQGRRGGGKRQVRKAAGKVAPNQRNYSNEMSLREAIWDVLDRSPEDWDKIIHDLPKDAEGLKVADIRTIIDHEKKWVSASNDISPQLQTQLHNLRKSGVIARTEDGQYYCVEGATLDKAPGKKR